jgi:magnesium-transporting ATPase (P-type)
MDFSSKIPFRGPLHAMSVADVFQALESQPAGLSPTQIQERLALYGSNVLREPPPEPLWRRFLRQSTHLMALVLWVAGGLACLSGRPVLGVVIWVVVLVNATFSFWQEYRAERALAALKRLLPAHARVLRDGQETQAPGMDLVPGDVLVLAEGDNIPADARVVEEYGLRLNQATLTGEAMPARKTSDASLRESLSELERPNLVFAGTSVVSGTGRAVIYATGMTTQFGRIANLTQTQAEPPSPLQHTFVQFPAQKYIARVTRLISLFALGLAAIVFGAGVFDMGLPLVQAFLFAIGLLVAAIPVGLPPTITLALAMAVQRLAQRGVLVKSWRWWRPSAPRPSSAPTKAEP